MVLQECTLPARPGKSNAVQPCKRVVPQRDATIRYDLWSYLYFLDWTGLLCPVMRLYLDSVDGLWSVSAELVLLGYK